VSTHANAKSLLSYSENTHKKYSNPIQQEAAANGLISRSNKLQEAAKKIL
jgi:hypothetical protein